MCDEDSTKIEVTPEDLTRVRSALQWVPQVELVEGLPEEAIVTSTPDDVHHPTQGKPIRVQLRAERMYVIWQHAAQGHQDTAGYRRECAFVAWVLLHESMHHLVREYGCAPGNKMSPPHLRSVNKSMDVVWKGAGVRVPNGESRHWLEDCLTGGCIVQAKDIPYDDPLHPDVEVPAGLALKNVISVSALRPRGSSEWEAWKLSGSTVSFTVFDDLALASTGEQVQVALDAIVARVEGTTPTIYRQAPGAGGLAKRSINQETLEFGVQHRDCYDAHERYRFPRVESYLQSLLVPEEDIDQPPPPSR